MPGTELATSPILYLILLKLNKVVIITFVLYTYKLCLKEVA